MRTFARLLETIGSVEPFDYPYALAGRGGRTRCPSSSKRIERRLPRFAPSMAGRSCSPAKAWAGASAAMSRWSSRSKPLSASAIRFAAAATDRSCAIRFSLELKTPILFAQGTRDPLCPLDLLEGVRKRMHAPSTLTVVEGGDHSLMVAKTALKALGSSQEEVDNDMLTAITGFLRESLAPPCSRRAQKALSFRRSPTAHIDRPSPLTPSDSHAAAVT